MPLTVTESLVLASEEKRARFKEAKERRRRAAATAITTYYDDPVAFADECIAWPEGQSMTAYQDELLMDLVKHMKVACRGPHTLGKTTTEAICLLWFAITRDAARVDWKVITTAGAWRQLEKYLWPEVHKWAKLLRWERIGRPRFTRHELLMLNLNLQFGSAGAVASDNPAFIEGAHATEILYIFDEAKAIPPAIFDAAEGAFAGADGARAYGLAMSTPGEPSGRFYQICTRTPGLEDWYPRHVTLDEAIAAGRLSRDWAEQRAKQWGTETALYANRVLGEFHSADEDGVIPLSWIEAAVERYKQHVDKRGYYVGGELGPLHKVGTDVARSGLDKTILALRYGVRIHEIRSYFHEDTMKTTGRVGGVLTANPTAIAVVDTDGLGAGVTDRLRELGYNVYAFHAGAKTDKRDRSKELGFINVRAAAWWGLREALDPAYGAEIELPDDPELLGDLTAPHWTVESNSRIKIESKDDIRKRLGRSTDRADAVVQAFWEERKRRRARMGNMGLIPEREKVTA